MIDGPTYAEVEERLRLREQREAHEREIIAAWRTRNSHAPCTDRVALLLAELERDFGGGR